MSTSSIAMPTNDQSIIDRQRNARALQIVDQLMEAHRFNVTAMVPSTVHGLLYEVKALLSPMGIKEVQDSSAP